MTDENTEVEGRIEFDDGSVIDATTLDQAKRAIATRAIVHGQLPKTVFVGGVLLKLENLQVRKQPTIPLITDDYVEETYNGWTIRVAIMGDGYGVNYFKEGTIRFLHVPGTTAPTHASQGATGVASAAAGALQEAVTEDEVFIYARAKIDEGS